MQVFKQASRLLRLGLDAIVVVVVIRRRLGLGLDVAGRRGVDDLVAIALGILRVVVLHAVLLGGLCRRNSVAVPSVIAFLVVGRLVRVATHAAQRQHARRGRSSFLCRPLLLLPLTLLPLTLLPLALLPLTLLPLTLLPLALLPLARLARTLLAFLAQTLLTLLALTRFELLFCAALALLALLAFCRFASLSGRTLQQLVQRAVVRSAHNLEDKLL